MHVIITRKPPSASKDRKQSSLYENNILNQYLEIILFKRSLYILEYRILNIYSYKHILEPVVQVEEKYSQSLAATGSIPDMCVFYTDL